LRKQLLKIFLRPRHLFPPPDDPENTMHSIPLFPFILYALALASPLIAIDISPDLCRIFFMKAIPPPRVEQAYDGGSFNELKPVKNTRIASKNSISVSKNNVYIGSARMDSEILILVAGAPNPDKAASSRIRLKTKRIQYKANKILKLILNECDSEKDAYFPVLIAGGDKTAGRGLLYRH
jgi:hypothetical protein